MMKTILFTAAFMTLAFAGFATTSAYACGGKPCAKCAHAQKTPCTKCVEGKKTCAKCKSAKNKPCEKTLGKKKPCTKTLAKKRSEIFFNE